MKTLRLTQTNLEGGHYQVDLEIEQGGNQRLTATSTFEFREDAADSEDVRWYLEEYLQDPADPGPARALRVEQRIQDLGTELFEAVFLSSVESRTLWDSVRHVLSSTRIEITIPGTRALPWEMLFDPQLGIFVASLAAAFVLHPSRATRAPVRPGAIDPVTSFW